MAFHKTASIAMTSMIGLYVRQLKALFTLQNIRFVIFTGKHYNIHFLKKSENYTFRHGHSN